MSKRTGSSRGSDTIRVLSWNVNGIRATTGGLAFVITALVGTLGAGANYFISSWGEGSSIFDLGGESDKPDAREERRKRKRPNEREQPRDDRPPSPEGDAPPPPSMSMAF